MNFQQQLSSSSSRSRTNNDSTAPPPLSTTTHTPNKNVREMIAATQNMPGLSSDEAAIYRFIQGMSPEKKEMLALGFINDMSPERKAEIEREILEDMVVEEKQQVSSESANNNNNNNNSKGNKTANPLSMLRSTANKIFQSPKKKTAASKAA